MGTEDVRYPVVAFLKGLLQEGASFRAASIDVGSVCDEYGGRFCLFCSTCPSKGTVSDSVDVSSLLKQALDQVTVSLVRCGGKWREGVLPMLILQ